MTPLAKRVREEKVGFPYGLSKDVAAKYSDDNVEGLAGRLSVVKHVLHSAVGVYKYQIQHYLSRIPVLETNFEYCNQIALLQWSNLDYSNPFGRCHQS